VTVSDIFSAISIRQVEALMLHNQLADYFDFLGLMGFKRLHEYQYISESAEMRGIHRYFINHYEMLIENKIVEAKNYIPSAWNGKSRSEVGTDARKEAVKNCMNTWVEWETDTKKMYESYYCDLCDLREIAGACKVKELVKDVDMELKLANRMNVKLSAIDYDMCNVMLMQEELHEKYKKKMEKVGVKIC
jgi:hypothetical protein